jgi:short-subunit dehydrogenase
MNNLSGCTAILTGATGGLGPHIARALADQGSNLVLAFLPGEDAGPARPLGASTRVVSVPTDIRDSSALERLVSRAKREFGAVDILVNNAGIETILPYHRLRVDDIEQIVRVNLVAAMILTWMVIPEMLQRGRGHIVNISSLAAKTGAPCSEPYIAAKAGVIGFTESLRAEYRGTGVSASVICPGFIETGIYKRLVDETGFEAPRAFGRSSPEAVGRAVVDAITKDRPEIIVNPGPTRLLTGLAELSPSVGAAIVRISGIAKWFRNVAATYDLRRH